MGRYVLIALAAFGLAVLQAGFTDYFPPLLRLVSPVLAFSLWLLMDVRLSYAVTAAVAAGLVAESVSSMPAGLITISLLIAVFVSWLLLTHVFTNQSFAAALGLQAAAFVIWQAVWLAFKAARLVVFGWSLGDAGVLPGWDKLLVALIAQLVVAAVIIVLARRSASLFSSVLMVASRPMHK
jgi:hypothetical protein